MEKKRAEFIVQGHVQGVGFRYFVLKKALELGLKGYAKNCYNGDVQVVAEGDESSLSSLMSQLKTGPSRSRVEKVNVSYSSFTGEFSVFDIG